MYAHMSDEEAWQAWQAEKQASHEADQRALAAGEKTREQLTRENGAVPISVTRAPLPWDHLLNLDL